MELTEAALRRQHALLLESREILSDGQRSGGESTADLMQRIDQETTAFERRST